MDGSGGEGGGEEGWRHPWGEVDNDDNNDDDKDNNNNDGGPSPQIRRPRPLADVRGDDGMIGGLLEVYHK